MLSISLSSYIRSPEKIHFLKEIFRKILHEKTYGPASNYYFVFEAEAIITLIYLY